MLRSSNRIKSTVTLATLLAIGGIYLTTQLTTWVKGKFHSVTSSYSMATDISSTQEIERIIDRSVYTSKSFVASQIAKKIVATQIESGGTTFTIYRFPFPQTCGKLGCLHVVVDERDKHSNSLQLIDLPDKSFPFSSVTKNGCFNVRQPVNNTIDDYEICKPS
jgi:hypothetical protein